MQLTAPETRIRVGSAPDCEWPIQASGVAPYHLEFYWDGQAAWVVPSGGPVSVGGQTVDAWHQIEGQTVVQFGQALVQVSLGQGIHSAESFEVSDSMMVLDPDDLVEDAPKPMASEATRVLNPSEGFGVQPKLEAPVGFPQSMLPQSVPAEDSFLPSGPTRVFDPNQGIVVESQAPRLKTSGFEAPDFEVSTFEAPHEVRPKLSASNQPTDVLPAVDGGRETESRFKLPPTRVLVLSSVTALAGLILILSTFFGDDPAPVNDTSQMTGEQQVEATAEQTDQATSEEGDLAQRTSDDSNASTEESILAERQAEERERQEREVRLTQEAQSRAQTLRNELIDELFSGREELESEEREQLAGRVEVGLALEAARAFAARHMERALGIYLYLREHYDRSDYDAFVEIVRERELCQDC